MSRRREGGKNVQRVRPRHYGGVAPGATRNARGASDRTWSRGRRGAEGNPPTSSVSPGRDDFGGIKGSSSDDSSTSGDGSSYNNSEDLSTLGRKPARDLESFGELPAL